MQQYLEAGRLVTTHGIAGELKAEIWCDSVSFLQKFAVLYLKADGTMPVDVVSVRAQKNMALITLKGVDSVEAAHALIGKVLYFDRKDAPLPKGQCFAADLIGCKVQDADNGREYGVVTDYQQPGAQYLFTVRAEDGKTYLMPDVSAFVKLRDPENGVVLVTPIPGLLDDGAQSDQG